MAVFVHGILPLSPPVSGSDHCGNPNTPTCNPIEILSSAGITLAALQEDAEDATCGSRARDEAAEGDKGMKKNEKWYRGSSLDDWLREEGWYEEFNATREKERIARQIDLAMKRQKITKKRMAELMKTSRTQVDKLLNPKDGNVTIKTLHKAAAVVGKRFEYKLV
jgi:antitoxin HicB